MLTFPAAHKVVEVPDTAEIFFVGDIHGESGLLKQVLKEIGYRPDIDYLFSVGDLIDRGPDNLGVLSRFLYDQTGRTFAVLGNHDQFMAQAATDDNATYNWMRNGGRWVLEAGLSEETLASVANDILAKFPVLMTVVHRDRKYGIVHGGIPMEYKDGLMESLVVPQWNMLTSGLEYRLTSPKINNYVKWNLINDYTWDRNVLAEFHAKEAGRKHAMEIPAVEGVDFVFHGHTYVSQPTPVGNRIYIDTGGVHKGTMTVVKGDNVLSYYTSGATKTLEEVALMKMSNGYPDPRLPTAGWLL